PRASNPTRLIRRKLEELRGSRGTPALEFVWKALNGDRWTQYAARTALESFPVEMWQERALANIGPRNKARNSRGNEAQAPKFEIRNPKSEIGQSLPTSVATVQAKDSREELAAQPTALLALARVGDRAIQPRVRDRLLWFVSQPMAAEQRLIAL